MNDRPVLKSDQRLRAELRALLAGRNAHMSFEDAVADFPLDAINDHAPNVSYSYWHLIEHLRIAQADILDFVVNPDYTALDWPQDYWPAPDVQATEAMWQESVASFLLDRASLVDLLDDPATDLTADLGHAPGYSIARELMLAADHNAYHIGELGILRQVAGLWPD